MSSFFRKLLALLASIFDAGMVKPGGGSSPPLPPANPPDAIPASEISWDEPAGDVGAWEVGASLVNPRMTRDGMRVDAVVGTEAWPLLKGNNPKSTIGTWWIIACTEGAWHGASADHYGRGKTSIVGKHWTAGRDGLRGPLAGWTGVRGERVFMMISTPARAGATPFMRRTPIYEGRMV